MCFISDIQPNQILTHSVQLQSSGEGVQSTDLRSAGLGVRAQPTASRYSERPHPTAGVSFDAPASVVLSYGVDWSEPPLMPKQYCMPSNVFMYTRPLAIESPPQWVHDVI